MAESAEHRLLVETIIQYATHRFSTVYALTLFSDRPGTTSELPPRIGGFAPDVFVADVPTTFTLIGEAKTEIDLLSMRSFNQISAYLRFLRSTPAGIFVLAVPWRTSAAARDILSRIVLNNSAHQVEAILLDGTNRSSPSSRRNAVCASGT
jgi:hypothetical protein